MNPLFAPRHRQKLAILIIAAASAVFTVLLHHRLTDAPNAGDGHNNLRTAYNLAYHGVFSAGSELRPSNYREPLPIAALALYIKMVPSLSADQTIKSINQGSAVVAVKQQNLIWAFMCLLGVGVVVFSSVRLSWLGVIAAMIAVALTYWLFLQRKGILDRTYTEIQAAALMVWCSFALIQALQTKKAVWFVAAGVLLGALALTKAAFLYVGIGLIVALVLAYGVWPPPSWHRRRALGLIALMLSAMALVVVPWMVRNFVQFGSFQITQRGGVVLMIRANYDTMNDVEFAVAFYHLTRSSSLRQRIGAYLGFSRDDLEIGGRLQRLNRDGSASFAASDLEAEKAGRPQDAVSFYRAARAERRRLTQYYTDQGVENPSHRTDKELQSKALSRILADPLQHLKTSIVFLWHGLPNVGNLPTTALALAALWAMAFVGLLRRNAVMIAIALFPVGAFLFFAVASHFASRLSAPMVPNLIMALIVATAWAAQWFVAMARKEKEVENAAAARAG